MDYIVQEKTGSSVRPSRVTGSVQTTGEGLAKFANLVLSCNLIRIEV